MDELAQRCTLEQRVFWLRWLTIPPAFLLVLMSQPPLLWLSVAALAGIAFNNVMRHLLIRHRTSSWFRRYGAMLLSLDSIVLMVGLWPSFRHGMHPVQQWLVLIPLETRPLMNDH